MLNLNSVLILEVGRMLWVCFSVRIKGYETMEILNFPFCNLQILGNNDFVATLNFILIIVLFFVFFFSPKTAQGATRNLRLEKCKLNKDKIQKL